MLQFSALHVRKSITIIFTCCWRGAIIYKWTRSSHACNIWEVTVACIAPNSTHLFSLWTYYSAALLRGDHGSSICMLPKHILALSSGQLNTTSIYQLKLHLYQYLEGNELLLTNVFRYERIIFTIYILITMALRTPLCGWLKVVYILVMSTLFEQLAVNCPRCVLGMSYGQWQKIMSTQEKIMYLYMNIIRVYPLGTPYIWLILYFSNFINLKEVEKSVITMHITINKIKLQLFHWLYIPCVIAYSLNIKE
mgnify:CR=1 FL=1